VDTTVANSRDIGHARLVAPLARDDAFDEIAAVTGQDVQALPWSA
jgi:hypothetical protein